MTENAHTDHPMRHFDRTCPACVGQENAGERCPVCESWRTDKLGCGAPICPIASPQDGLAEELERWRRLNCNVGSESDQLIGRVLAALRSPQPAEQQEAVAWKQRLTDAAMDAIQTELNQYCASGFPAPKELLYRAADCIGALRFDVIDNRKMLSHPPSVAPREAKPSEGAQRDAERYRWLRTRDLDAIQAGGVFAGLTPRNVVLNGADLDAAIDAARQSCTCPRSCVVTGRCECGCKVHAARQGGAR